MINLKTIRNRPDNLFVHDSRGIPLSSSNPDTPVAFGLLISIDQEAIIPPNA
jgi:hypothetical protein